MEKKFESIEPSEIVKNIDISDEPEIERGRESINPVALQDTKRKLDSELPTQDKIYFCKIDDKGKRFVIDFEADKQSIISYGSIENLVRKNIVPLYGYGEYIPYTVEYDKDGKKKEKYGASINILKPIETKIERDNNYSNMIAELRNTILEMQKREDERRQQEEQRIKEIMMSNNSNNNNDVMALVIQQMNNMMLFMMENMKKNNSSPMDFVKVVEPIINKIKDIENKIEEKNFNNILPETIKDDKKENPIELIKSIKDIIQPTTTQPQQELSIIKELKEELIQLRNDNRQLQDRLLTVQIETLKNEVEKYRDIAVNREDEIEKFMDMYEKVTKLSSRINPESSSSLNGVLQSLIEKAPDFISMASQSDRERMQQLLNENISLKNKVNELAGIIGKINQKIKERKMKSIQGLQNNNQEQNTQENKLDKQPVVVKKISESIDNNKQIPDKIDKINVNDVIPKTDNTDKDNINVNSAVKNNTKQKNEKRKTKKRKTIFDSVINDEVIKYVNSCKTDEDIVKSIDYIIQLLLNDNNTKSHILLNISKVTSQEEFRDFIYKLLDDSGISEKVSNIDLIKNCIAKNSEKWYKSFLSGE